MNPERPLHAGAWLLWVTAALAVFTVTRNPAYVALALLCIGVTLVQARRTPIVPGLGLLSPLRFGLIVVPLAAFFNALFVHVGETVLLRLPAGWPFAGAAITLEALIYGALNGLVLTGIFAAFTVFNLMTPVRALVRMAPRAWYPAAVTLAIAVTFVPVTLRQAEQIREAQAVRGAQMRGLRAWLPLFLPLLTSGLERALQLAEAMVARGFAAQTAAQTERASMRTQLLIIAGVLLIIAAWLLRIAGLPKWEPGLVQAALLAGGLALVGSALQRAGRSFRHTVYRPQPWTGAEWLVAAGALFAAGLYLVPLPGVDRSSLAWSPYPALALPGVSPLPALALWGLLAPLLVAQGRGAP